MALTRSLCITCVLALFYSTDIFASGAVVSAAGEACCCRRMKRRRLVRQRQWRAAAEQQAAAVGNNYDGTSYCTDNYSEHAGDPYHAEVPPWANNWQESGYSIVLLSFITDPNYPMMQQDFLHLKSLTIFQAT